MKLWQVILTFVVLAIAWAYVDDAIKACGVCQTGAGW
jgi:hypothetical protein